MDSAFNFCNGSSDIKVDSAYYVFMSTIWEILLMFVSSFMNFLVSQNSSRGKSSCYKGKYARYINRTLLLCIQDISGLILGLEVGYLDTTSSVSLSKCWDIALKYTTPSFFHNRHYVWHYITCATEKVLLNNMLNRKMDTSVFSNMDSIKKMLPTDTFWKRKVK